LAVGLDQAFERLKRRMLEICFSRDKSQSCIDPIVHLTKRLGEVKSGLTQAR